MTNKQIAKFLRGCAGTAPVEVTDAVTTMVVPGTNLIVRCLYN